MKYYTNDGKEIIIPDNIVNKKINACHGECGTIYRYTDSLCFKRYDRNIQNEVYFLGTDIYKVLSQINSPNLVDIKELLFKDKEKRNVADAYILKYYIETYESLLERPTEYLLTNMEGIFSLLKEISNYEIRIRDLKRENLIFTDKHIVLIDPDWWYFYKLNKKEILKLNINNIMGLFNRLIETDLRNNYSDFFTNNNLYEYVVSNKLFPITNNPDKAMKVLSKRLGGYKKPIDYVYSLKK